MEILLTILLVLVALVVIAYLAGFVIPDHVRMERDMRIEAPRETVFALISNFHEWPKWSPWADRDPNTHYVIEGEGVGHTMTWTSEKKDVGNGKQVVTGIEEPSWLKNRLDFGSMGQADAIFTLTEEPGATHVTWAFDTHMREGVPVFMQPMATYMGFMMEKFLAPDYESGLTRLKKVAEEAEKPVSAPAPASSPTDAPVEGGVPPVTDTP